MWAWRGHDLPIVKRDRQSRDHAFRFQRRVRKRHGEGCKAGQRDEVALVHEPKAEVRKEWLMVVRREESWRGFFCESRNRVRARTEARSWVRARAAGWVSRRVRRLEA